MSDAADQLANRLERLLEDAKAAMQRGDGPAVILLLQEARATAEQLPKKSGSKQ